MSAEKTCICGKNHDKDIVITITHCNKHNPTSKICKNVSHRQHSAENFEPKHTSSKIIHENSLLQEEKNQVGYGLVLYCEEDDGDSGDQGESETFCVLDNCPIEQLMAILAYKKAHEKHNHSYNENKNSLSITDLQNSSSKHSSRSPNSEPNLNKRHDTESNLHKNIWIEEPLPGQYSKQKLKTHARPSSETALIADLSKKQVKIRDSVNTSKAIDEELITREKIDKQKDVKAIKKVDKDINKVAPIKDDNQNFSQEPVALPSLPGRYHGPGCCMEIDVLEKHNPDCSYMKQKNPNRNIVDDSAGSYEVIGRLNFKTCDVTTVDNKDENAATLRNLEIYHMLAIPDRGKLELLESFSDKQFDVLRNYLKRRKVLKSLVQSSKSFPKHFQHGGTNNSNASTHTENSINSTDIEELFFHNNKNDQSSQISRCDKSIQISGIIYKHCKHKKWFYFLFPCIFPRRIMDEKTEI